MAKFFAKFRYFVWIGVVIGLGLSLFGFMAGFVWQAEMITPFRPQLLLAGVVALGAAWLLREKMLLIAAICLLLSNGLPMTYRSLIKGHYAGRVTEKAQALRLLSVNVLCDNQHYDRVIDLITQQDPEVVVAVETTPEWIAAFEVLKGRYPYRYSLPDAGVFGITIMAKQPFEARLIETEGTQMPLVRVEFSHMVVYGVHPMPPARRHLYMQNKVYLEHLAYIVKDETKPAIMAGDFNATLWSHNLSPLMTSDIQWPRGSGLGYSWPSGKPLMAIQIDHILTKGAVDAKLKILGDVGSDHRPVRADIVLK